MSHANGVYPELMECFLKQGYGKCMALLVFHIHIASEVSLEKVKADSLWPWMDGVCQVFFIWFVSILWCSWGDDHPQANFSQILSLTKYERKKKLNILFSFFWLATWIMYRNLVIFIFWFFLNFWIFLNHRICEK